MGQDSFKLGDGRVPLLIGVTGHRDLRLEDVPHLENSVQSVFDQLRVDAPNSPFILLSQLAEGADRLVAKVALSAGAVLFAPMPFSIEDYESDFATDSSKGEFRKLAAQAEKVFAVPRIRTERERGYTDANIYVVRHCDVLIALWDGEESENQGGTAQAVHFKLNGVPSSEDLSQRDFDAPETGPVFQIVTPRQSGSEAPLGAFSLNLRFAGDIENGQEKFRRKLEYLETYNRDVRRLKPSGKRFALGCERLKVPESVSGIDNAFQVADALAQDFQRRRQRSLRVSIGCVLIAIISFETFADIVPDPILGTLYPALLIAALVIYLYDRKQDYLRKHLDYRALAEGMRVQYYWNLVEVPHNVGNEYLRQHRSELDWIRSSLRSLGMMASLADSQQIASEMDRFVYVADAWVFGQRRYFAKTVQRVGKWLGRQEKKISIAFVFGLSVAMVICIAQWTISDWARIWRDRLIWLLVVVPAVAAVAGNYADKLASYEQIRRCDCMIGIFDRALRKLREHLAAQDFESARDLIFELGKEALEENAEWVITRRDRELDPPEAG